MRSRSRSCSNQVTFKSEGATNFTVRTMAHARPPPRWATGAEQRRRLDSSLPPPGARPKLGTASYPKAGLRRPQRERDLSQNGCSLSRSLSLSLSLSLPGMAWRGDCSQPPRTRARTPGSLRGFDCPWEGYPLYGSAIHKGNTVRSPLFKQGNITAGSRPIFQIPPGRQLRC